MVYDEARDEGNVVQGGDSWECCPRKEFGAADRSLWRCQEVGGVKEVVR
jgi:hypothetical protein